MKLPTLEEVIKASTGPVPVLVDWVPNKSEPQVFKRLEIKKDPFEVMSKIERQMFPEGAEARRARGERVDFTDTRKLMDGAGEQPLPRGAGPLPASAPVPSGGRIDRLTAEQVFDKPEPPAPRPSPSSATLKDEAGRASGVRKTSLEAYAKLRLYGKLSAQQQSIIYLFLLNPAPRTRQEIAKEAGLTINATCGRVKELLDLGVLSEVGRKTCAVTSNDVNALVLSTKGPEEGP